MILFLFKDLNLIKYCMNIKTLSYLIDGKLCTN